MVNIFEHGWSGTVNRYQISVLDHMASTRNPKTGFAFHEGMAEDFTFDCYHTNTNVYHWFCILIVTSILIHGAAVLANH